MEFMVKRITGRFKHLDDIKLERLKLELKFLLRSWGAVGSDIQPSEDFPLWAEVEFLDNIVRFELSNNPFLGAEVAH